MKSILLLSSFMLCFLSCVPESQNKYLNYQNLVILSDLSSRIENKPPKDIEQIQKIIHYFKNECVKPGEKIGDKSSISFSTFSKKIAFKIDLSEFKHLGDKQQFINSTGPYTTNGFNSKLNELESKVKEVYASTRNEGLDLISILIEKIENEHIIKKDTFFTDGIDTTFVTYDNHIYIFTDGYLEYKNKEVNKQFYFGNTEIETIRTYCNQKKVNISKALEENPSLCLPSSRRKKHELATLHMLETHERDKDEIHQTYSHPTGIRDNEILEAIWTKWSKDSGFKDITWEKY